MTIKPITDQKLAAVDATRRLSPISFSIGVQIYDELRKRLQLAEEQRDQWHEWADAHGAEVERLTARLKLADAVVEATAGSANANSQKELRGWYRDIDEALAAYRALDD